MGYEEEGISLQILVKEVFEKAKYPDFRKGDSIELFFDTRDNKKKGFNTRFCHHFVFYPEEVKGSLGKEVSRFRSDDMHKLCNSEDLIISSKIEPKSYFMDIIIPSFCLYGYDPTRMKSFGFTYRINRGDKDSQYFTVISKEFTIEQNPSLWASMKMVK